MKPTAFRRDRPEESRQTAIRHRQGLIAKGIHANSARADHVFVPVNSGSVPPDLLESTLFGHSKGAFARLGSGATVRVDVRILAATNADLQRSRSKFAWRNSVS